MSWRHSILYAKAQFLEGCVQIGIVWSWSTIVLLHRSRSSLERLEFCHSLYGKSGHRVVLGLHMMTLMNWNSGVHKLVH